MKNPSCIVMQYLRYAFSSKAVKASAGVFTRDRVNTNQRLSMANFEQCAWLCSSQLLSLTINNTAIEKTIKLRDTSQIDFRRATQDSLEVLVPETAVGITVL